MRQGRSPGWWRCEWCRHLVGSLLVERYAYECPRCHGPLKQHSGRG